VQIAVTGIIARATHGASRFTNPSEKKGGSVEYGEKITMAGFPKTETDGQARLMMGLLLLAAAAIIWRIWRAME